MPEMSYDAALGDGRRAYLAAFAEGLEPDPDVSVSEWAGEHRYVAAETSAFPGKWDNDLFPPMREIVDCLTPSHPAEHVTLMKSAQVAGSEGGMNWLGLIVDLTPGPTMVVHPTIDAGKDWVREKLTPTIEVTPRLRAKIEEDRSRSNKGSTGMFKKFPGGFIRVGGANSAASLRQHSIRFMIKDDWDEWPLDVGEQGDPDKMADARQIGFHKSGTAKQFRVSTPTIKAVSRVWRAYQDSDRRICLLPCPDCGHEQELKFFPDEGPDGRKRGGLVFDRAPPHNPHYACAECGVLIPPHRLAGMLKRHRWHAEKSGPGRQPGFRLNALYSPFTTWDRMVEAFLEAKDQPRLLKTFYNLWLGEPWEDRGDAPEWMALYRRRVDYPLGRLPAGALLVTAGVDVQKDYLRIHVKGFGIGKTSWTVDVAVLEGDTAQPAVWAALDAYYERGYEDWQGRPWKIDMMAVDSGYNTHAVYAWCRERERAMAIKGMPGHLHPALGVAAKQDVNYGGRRRRGAVMLWPVGTWTLKSEFYGHLRKTGPDQAGAFPPGWCHFSTGLDEDYFRQITAEALVTHQRNGREITEWVTSGPNHGLDCEIYALAALERLGVSTFRVHHWQQLAADRGAPAEDAQRDLAALWAEQALPARQQAAPDGTPGMTHDAAPDRTTDDGRAAPRDVRLRGGGAVRLRTVGGLRVRNRPNRPNRPH